MAKKRRKPRRPTPKREVFERARRATVAFGVVKTNKKGERVPKITGSGFATRIEPGMVVTAKHVLSKDNLMLLVPKAVTKNSTGDLEANYDFVAVARAHAVIKHDVFDVATLIFPNLTFSSEPLVVAGHGGVTEHRADRRDLRVAVWMDPSTAGWRDPDGLRVNRDRESDLPTSQRVEPHLLPGATAGQSGE